MIQFSGYKVTEEIYNSENSKIFRATRDSDNIPVVIKLLNREYPSTKELSAFIREYEIMNKVTQERIIKAYSLEKYSNSLAIIMEDIGAESVAKVLKSFKADINEKLSLAIQMTESLIQLHKHNIVHKDVNPSNFIWNINTNQVKIIDFGISAELMREASQCINLNVLEGTLNYISPEQTGRINRPIDYRTDLYSLGITFYELFTGKMPFHGDDELELIYSHIAKKPISPIEINPEIPSVLSDIIMKLMAKAAEERYQSAFGLMKDLELCKQLLEEKRSISGFIPGQKDIFERFEIPHKLYGREAEIEMLINAFERAADGTSELVLVSGYSGIGKSSLIHEIRKSITGKRGFFISGKYDQFERNIPYYGITQAFKELIKQLLAQPQHRLDDWKERLIAAMGNNAQVIVDILPELEQIIGPQPQVTELNPLEAQNRFQMTFKEFIKVFAKPEHPLVIFLDDIQWSDTSTLDLIKYIVSTGNVNYVLFIGAYRDNEVQEGHPLNRMINELINVQDTSLTPIHQISLKPLDISSINQLIADTFHCHTRETEALTNIIFHKTKGNPFFINQLLTSLYLEGAFTFLPEKGQWVYDLKKVEAVGISDNVVDLLVKGLALLPEETMHILKLVACIGTQFDLKTVSIISEKTVAEIGKALWIAIEKEIILPLNNNYKYINTLKNEMNPVDLDMYFCFAHDRIRQAVYSLIPEDEKEKIHWLIGQEYLKIFRDTKRADEIFDMVNHLNIGRNLILNKDERIELADLNITAGNKAKKSTAFTVALNYYETARSLLSDQEWELMPDKFFSLLLEQAKAALLSWDLPKADGICDYLSTIAKTNLEKGAVSNIKVLSLVFQGKLYETIVETRKTLHLFNISLPETQEEINQKLQEYLKKMQEFLARIPVEEYVNLPVMEDPEKLMAMQLLYQVAPPAIQANPQLYMIVTLIMFEMTMTYGTSPLACKCFADCSVIVEDMFGDYDTGYKLGEAAFALIKKLKAESQKPPVCFMFTYTSYWKVHYQEALDYYDMSYRTGLETGDLMHVTYAIAHKMHLYMWVGKNLSECRKETENTIAFLKQTKSKVPLILAQFIYYIIEKFQTLPSEDAKKDFDIRDKEMISVLEKLGNLPFMVRYFQYNTYVNIISGNMEEAEKWNMMAEKLIFASLTDFPAVDHYLFQGLILVNKWNKVSLEEQCKIKENLCVIKQKLKNWAEHCPANFAHKYHLLSAEMAKIENEPLDTVVDHFRKAMDSIGKNDFIQFKALIKELYGKFWLEKGDETIGKAYIREAHYLYKRWGAHRKVSLLERQYSHYFTSEENTLRSTFITRGATSSLSNIDMRSILKSSQAISSEIKRDKLLTILISTMIENAGAERGCLLLHNEADDQFYIEAVQCDNASQLNVAHSHPFTESRDLCVEIVQYVIRTKETIVIHNACKDDNWQNNPYIAKKRIKSVLCIPVIYQNRLKGVVYLENNLSDNVFTSERLETLQILSSQASISIENARLYENMEEKVRERTMQLNAANEKLKELSLRDPLTNLHNRRYAFEFANDKIAQFIKNKTPLMNNNEKRQLSVQGTVVGVILIDIDHFKQVNDVYGHSAGDTVLVTISNILKGMIRSEDLLVRWGGEEFLIILYNTKPDYLRIFSKKVLEKIRETPIKISENQVIYKTCSLGYSEMPLLLNNPGLFNLEHMINLSDYAMYRAKENGRNCAAQFKLVQQEGKGEEIKNYLVNLSKCDKVNEEYFNIEFI
ncbi:AAA family ATPase [Acetivibrio clariflavus]|uniref:AAA family ATPase n=2 Tax=Acetivibrio clariflavus TaxID=288965 RepID=UPI0031F4E72C